MYSLLQYLCHEEDALSISCRRISIVSNHKCQSEEKVFSIHNKSSHTLTSHSLFIGKEKEVNCTLYLESPTNLKYTNTLLSRSSFRSINCERGERRAPNVYEVGLGGATLRRNRVDRAEVRERGPSLTSVSISPCVSHGTNKIKMMCTLAE